MAFGCTTTAGCCRPTVVPAMLAVWAVPVGQCWLYLWLQLSRLAGGVDMCTRVCTLVCLTVPLYVSAFPLYVLCVCTLVHSCVCHVCISVCSLFLCMYLSALPLHVHSLCMPMCSLCACHVCVPQCIPPCLFLYACHVCTSVHSVCASCVYTSVHVFTLCIFCVCLSAFCHLRVHVFVSVRWCVLACVHTRASIHFEHIYAYS